MKLSKVLTNKYVLYVVVFFTMINLFGYLTMGNVNALFYFAVIGLIARFFSKNMIIVLLSALLLSNLLIAGQNYSEGFTSDSTGEKSTDSKKVVKDPKTKTSNASVYDTISEDDQTLLSTVDTPVATDDTSLTVTDNTSLTVTDNTPLTVTDNTDNTPVTVTDEPFQVGADKSSKNYRVDYASTIEDAYGQLNEVLGSEGIKRLTDDTQNLLKQQIQLADAMKSMGPLISNMAPLIEQTKGLMNGIGGFDIKDLGSFASLAKGFAPSGQS
jgi:hypothetical protein